MSTRGKFIWEIKTEGQARGDQTFGRALIFQLRVDSGNNLIVAGSIGGAVDFDPTAGKYIPLSSDGEDATLSEDNDAYIAKYTPAGGLIFAQTVGGDWDEVGRSLAIGGDDSIYLAGTFTGRADFDPAPTRAFFLDAPPIVENEVSDPDLFLARFSSAGNLITAGSIEYTTRGSLTHFGLNSAKNSAILVVGTPGSYPPIASIDDHSSHLYRYDF